jgi:hypothetical protein
MQRLGIPRGAEAPLLHRISYRGGQFRSVDSQTPSLGARGRPLEVTRNEQVRDANPLPGSLRPDAGSCCAETEAFATAVVGQTLLVGRLPLHKAAGSKPKRCLRAFLRELPIALVGTLATGNVVGAFAARNDVVAASTRDAVIALVPEEGVFSVVP